MTERATDEQAEECDVLVIGAGIAGIAAARTLYESHIRTIVLEAQNRVGGRVKGAKLTRNLLNTRNNSQLSKSREDGIDDDVNNKLSDTSFASQDGEGEASQIVSFDDIASEGLKLETREKKSNIWGGGNVYKVVVSDSEDDEKDNYNDNDGKKHIEDCGDDSEGIDGNEPYIFVELGPNWIHGLSEDLNPLLNVSKHLGLSLQPTSSDDDPGDDVKLFSSRGGACSSEDYLLAQQRYEWIRDNVLTHAHGFQSAKGLMEHLLTISTRVESLGKINNAQRRIFQWFLDRMSIDIGNSLDEVGLGSITDEQNDGLGGEAFIKGANDGTRLRGGFTAIVDHLAQEYSLDIRLNHVVRSIDYCEEEDRVYVHTMPYLHGKKFVAKKVIITIPFGALKWDSPTMLFSEGKAPKCIRDLLAQPIDMGLTNLIWLWYPEQFWEDGYSFIGITHEADENLDLTTFLIPHIVDNMGQKRPVLLAQVAGEFAKSIESMTNQEIADRVHQTLQKIFPDCPRAIGLTSSKWGIDPYSRGSWTYFPVKDGLRGIGDRRDQLPEMFVVYCCGCMNYYCCKCVCTFLPPTPPTSSVASSTDHEDGEESGEQKGDAETQLTALDRAIFYAGEAVSLINRGTAHGAYRMGLKAADDVISALEVASIATTATSVRGSADAASYNHANNTKSYM